MPDPDIESASASRANAEASANGEARREQRSFQTEASDAAHATSKQVHQNTRAVGEAARQAGGAMRDLAETGRQQANQVVETWRSAMDPFTAMHMDMNRWFDDLWRRTTGMSTPALRPAGLMGALGPAPMFGLPAADLRETDEAYLITVELAGLTRDDVDLQVRGDLLILSGHKSEARDDGAATYRLSERRFGRFERSFPVPPDADPAAIDAQFKDGVLTITLPRARDQRPLASKIAIR
jgi:HSP20 family protein